MTHIVPAWNLQPSYYGDVFYCFGELDAIYSITGIAWARPETKFLLPQGVQREKGVLRRSGTGEDKTVAPADRRNCLGDIRRGWHQE